MPKPGRGAATAPARRSRAPALRGLTRLAPARAPSAAPRGPLSYVVGVRVGEIAGSESPPSPAPSRSRNPFSGISMRMGHRGLRDPPPPGCRWGLDDWHQNPCVEAGLELQVAPTAKGEVRRPGPPGVAVAPFPENTEGNPLFWKKPRLSAGRGREHLVVSARSTQALRAGTRL